MPLNERVTIVPNNLNKWQFLQLKPICENKLVNSHIHDIICFYYI